MASSSDLEIDVKRLPRTVALDAGVLMLAWNEKVHRPDTPACRALWHAVIEPTRLEQGARVLIPAPVLAELTRGTKPSDPPRIKGVHVAPFTSRSARLLSTHLPHAFIEQQMKDTGLPRAYLKYDALIIAIALAYEATLVTLDGWPRAQKLPFPIVHPTELLSAQTSLRWSP